MNTRPLAIISALVIANALCAPVIAEEALGRLFFTPERRQALDHQREFNIQENQVEPEEPALTINGVVSRSSGRRTVWVNGQPQDENEAPGGIVIDTTRQKPGEVEVRSDDKRIGRVNVGDTINRNTGDVSPVLNGGRIITKAHWR